MVVKRARSDVAKDERRQKLLAVALDEFFQKGFAAARTDDIARRADLSKGTLYLYFESKQALFIALIETLAMPNIGQIELISMTAPSIREALNRLVAFAPTMVRQSNLPRLMKVLIGDSHNFPDIVRNYRTQILDRVLGAMAHLLTCAKERGEIEIGDPKLMARLVVAPIALSGIWHALFADDPDAQVDLEMLFRMHADLLLKAISPLENGA
jgi:AcrR family transcriptional regulator